MAADMLEMLDGLRATRDPDSCLRGLNLFRKALRGDEGPLFLARYLRASPEWQELQAVWDTQLTVQHYHVTVTLLLALADALGVAGTAAGAPTPADAESAARGAALAAGAGGLAAAVLHRRLKALYFCLSSDQRGKANAALTLLSAVAATCGSGAAPGAPSLRDLVRAFDWSLSSLPGLARPPRAKKGESAAEQQRRYRQQWALGDALKRPTRAGLCDLALALLRGAAAAGDALLAQQLLRLRPLAGGLLAHLAADPPAHQLEVIALLQRRVLAPRAGVPAGVQAELFGGAALAQLATIAAAAPADEEEEEEAAGETEAAGERTLARQAAAAALAVLLAVATDPAHGLAAGGAGPPFALADAGSHPLQPGQRRLLQLLLRLRPADSAAHLRLLLAAAEADAPLAAALLLALPYGLEPAAAAAGSAAAGRWVAHAAVAAALLGALPAAAPPGLAAAAAAGGAPPMPGGRAAQALLRCCLPPCLPKAALSRGLQHGNALVRQGSLALLVAALSALGTVLADCDAAAAAAPPGTTRDAGWAALRRWLQRAARQQLPDPTLLLALLASAEKEGWQQANELQLTAVLRLLLLWQRILPAALAEAHVDAERLLPPQPLDLRPQHQLLLLQLLAAAADAADADGDGSGEAASGASAAAVPLPVLRLLVGAGVAAPVRAAARAWLLRRLLATGAFGSNPEEAALWLDLLPRGGTGAEAAAGFVAEAVQLLLRRPHELWELQAAAAGAGGGRVEGPAGGSAQPPQFSLLAPCALRQALRVARSGKAAAADKACVATYVAATLRQLAQQQLDGGGLQLAAVLLGTARLEAARQQQQQQQQQQQGDGPKEARGKVDSTRKRAGGEALASSGAAALLLPPEAAPLLSLLAEAERHLGGEPPAEAPAGKKRKKGRRTDEAGGAAASAASFAAPPANGGSGDPLAAEAAVAAAGACCLLVGGLAGGEAAGRAQRLAAVQQRLAGDAGACAGTVRQCLHLLRSQPGAPALLQALQAAVAAAAAAPHELRRCLQLLAGSELVAQALAGDDGLQALAAAVVSSLLLLPQGAGSSSEAAAAASQSLLGKAAAAFLSCVEGAARQPAGAAPPPAACRFLALLPRLPADAVDEAARTLLSATTASELDLGGSGSGGKRYKQRHGAAAAQETALPAWLGSAAAAVLDQQLAAGRAPGQLPAACHVLCRLAAVAADGDGSGAAALGCLRRLLHGPHGAQALAALAPSGQAALLRACLAPAVAGVDAALEPAADVARALATSSAACRALAAGELLPPLLDVGRGAGALALALPAALACLEERPDNEPVERAGGGAAAGQASQAALAAALSRRLLAHFTASSGGGQRLGGSEPPAEPKKRRGDATAAVGEALPAAAAMLRRHALPCLRVALARQPLSTAERRRPLRTELLPASGWGADAAAAGAAEAAVALLAAGDGGESVAELAACVRCLAATLAPLLKQPAGWSELEARLLALLDGPVGDAVAALSAQQRGTPEFGGLAAAAAGTLGTAVLRHRLAAAAGGASDAAAAAAGLAAVRVLRRFMAALLPEEGEEEQERSGGAGGQQQHGNSEVAAAAAALLQRLLAHSRFLHAMRAVAACPPPLPPAAAGLARPLASALPLAAAADGEPGGSPARAAGDADAAPQLKRELCELLETLLDVHQRYGGSAGRDGQLARDAEAALLPLLMAGYGASCSPADAAAWSLAAAINARQWRRRWRVGEVGAEAEAAADAADGDADAEAAAALLHGPLAEGCFAWGPAAAAAQQLPAAAQGADAAAQRLQLLRRLLPLDPARAALTVCHWPEGCALADPGSSAAADGSGGGGGGGAALTQLPSCAAAYDPGFLLPFCCACLRQRLLGPRAFAEAGLLSVCLRGLAAEDAALRAAAYQAVALFEAALGAADAPDFREKAQLSVLLRVLRAAATRPFQRLPAVHGVLLAEASLLALHPGAELYPAVMKHLARRAVLSTTDVPLLGQLLLAGGQGAQGQRRWLLRLVLAGLRGAQDAALYRRQHVAELAMSLADSSVADGEAAALALRLVCVAACVPRAARRLAQEAGLVPWLAAAAEAAARRALAPGARPQHDAPGAAAADEALAAPLRALRRLLRLRAVMRGSGGAGAARQMAEAAHRLAAAALAAAGGGAAAPAASVVVASVLPFVEEVQQQLTASGQHGPRAAAGEAAAAGLTAAVAAMRRLAEPDVASAVLSH